MSFRWSVGGERRILLSTSFFSLFFETEFEVTFSFIRLACFFRFLSLSSPRRKHSYADIPLDLKPALAEESSILYLP